MLCVICHLPRTNTNSNILSDVIIDWHTLALARGGENGAPDDGCCIHSWVHHHRYCHRKGCHHHEHSHFVKWIVVVDVNDVTLGKEFLWGFLIDPCCCNWLPCPEMSCWFLCIRRICIIAVITSLMNHGFFIRFRRQNYVTMDSMYREIRYCYNTGSNTAECLDFYRHWLHC